MSTLRGERETREREEGRKGGREREGGERGGEKGRKRGGIHTHTSQEFTLITIMDVKIFGAMHKINSEGFTHKAWDNPNPLKLNV